MAVVLKSAEEIERMRVAGRLASEVLDFIAPHVKPGVSTGRLNDLCHDYMVRVQRTVPAPLNYAPPGYKPFPKSICTSVNHQVCHGVPGERVLKPGDILNIDITVIKDGFHGDCSRMFHEEPQVLHYGRPATGLVLEPGMTFTVEPMINAGKPGIRELADGWTIVTKDHSLSAQWEHTVAVTQTGYEVLTQSAGSMAEPALA
jgi:methionyl aminopeptidase